MKDGLNNEINQVQGFKNHKIKVEESVSEEKIKMFIAEKNERMTFY